MRYFLVELGRLGFYLLLIASAIWTVFFVDSCASPGPDAVERAPAAVVPSHPNPVLRVNLNELEGNSFVQFRSDRNPLVIRADRGGRILQRIPTARDFTVGFQGNNPVSGAGDAFQTGGDLFIQPDGAHPVQVGNRSYRGSFQVRSNGGGQLQVINFVRLEQYLPAVVGREMGRGRRKEALRAQAVAARTYALWEREVNRPRMSASSPYDLENTVQSQVYRGVEDEGESTIRAVRDTEGVILSYRNRIYPSVYHSTCGGITVPASRIIPGIEGNPAPLQGGVRCPWDDISPHHRREVRLTGEEIADQMFPEQNISRITSIEVQERDPYQRVREVVIGWNGGARNLSADEGRQIHRIFRRIQVDSLFFDVTTTGEGSFVFQISGRGHGAGMCQWGAIGAAREGVTYQNILRRYYPGIQIFRM